MVARYLGVVEAVGSSPVTQTKKASFRFGGYLLFLFLYECAGLEANSKGFERSEKRLWEKGPGDLLIALLDKSRHSDQKSVDFVGGFFIQADRLGISSRDSVYIIAAFMRRISSHHRCAYLYRLDEIQWLCH